MSAHHPRCFDPRQDTSRMSMRCGVGATLWETVPAIHECSYPDSSELSEVSDSSWSDFDALIQSEES